MNRLEQLRTKSVVAQLGENKDSRGFKAARIDSNADKPSSLSDAQDPT
jgi:hypothetical protein